MIESGVAKMMTESYIFSEAQLGFQKTQEPSAPSRDTFQTANEWSLRRV